MEINFFKKPLFWLTLLLLLVWTAIFSWPDRNLHLIFCNVGQGDAILISYQKTQILIDGGPDNLVLNCLAHHLPFWDRQIEMVVLTHPEKDHFGGLIDVIKRYNLKYLISTSWPEEGRKTTALKEGDEIHLGKINLSVLWPRETNQKRKLNENSLVLKLSFGSFQALLPGDIPSEIENQLDLTPVEVLKVAHHGSLYSTSQTFLEKIKPKLAVVSVGKNKFGHPTKETLKRLEDLGIRVLRTDQNGEIEIVSDGQEWYTRAHDSRPN